MSHRWDQARALRDDLFAGRKRKPAWFDDVVATAVGPKITDGRASRSEAIQLIVHRKSAERRLPLANRIPKSLDGIVTDVVRLGGELEAPQLRLSAPASLVGLGTPIESDDKTSTLAAAGASSESSAVVIGCAHGVGLGRLVKDERGGRIGKCVKRVTTLMGRELGVGWNPHERFLIDLSVIALDHGVATSAGLPGGAHFRVPRPLQIAARLPGSGAWALSGRRELWMQGVITSLWPRPSDPSLAFTGLCLVQHSPLAVSGDSGTMWLARVDGQPTAIGTHYGLDWSQRRAPRLAFVSLALEGLRQDSVAVEG